jgi:hypothetical protein
MPKPFPHLLVLGVILCKLFVFSAFSHAQDKPCSANPEIIGKGFVVHGRLSLGGGAPAIVLWRIGTHRLLGILGISKEDRDLPLEVKAKLNYDTVIFGDFLVYPLTASKPGVMQLVCIESATNLVIQKRPIHR